MKELQRHRLAFNLLTPLVAVFLKIRFRFEYDKLDKIEGPYLLVANHNLELDAPVMGVAVGSQLYFVASEHLLRKGFGTWFIMTFFRPIIHMKGKQGIQTIKQMLKTLKEGQSVCIFPEGNRSFNGLTGDILPSIGKVARRCGAKLVTYRIEGGYLSQPRWALTLRKGKLRGRLIGEYSPEELKSMTDEQVNQIICDDLYEDAYETQKKNPIAFRGKNLALGMESTVFVCPSCGGIGTLHSQKDRIHCESKECGFEAIYDVYGILTDKEGKTYTVTELDRMQREVLRNRLDAYCGEDPLFSDEVVWYEIDKNHEFNGTKNGTLAAYDNRFEFCGRKLMFDEIQGIAIYSRNAMILHIQDQEGHIEIKADKMFNALKYLYLFNMKQKVE